MQRRPVVTPAQFVLFVALVLVGCASPIPCPGTAKAVFETCSCHPVESRMLTRSKALDPALHSALSECLAGDFGLEYTETSASKLAATGKLNGCIKSNRTIDAATRTKLLEVVAEASAKADDADITLWRACYQKVTGQGPTTPNADLPHFCCTAAGKLGPYQNPQNGVSVAVDGACFGIDRQGVQWDGTACK